MDHHSRFITETFKMKKPRTSPYLTSKEMDLTYKSKKGKRHGESPNYQSSNSTKLHYETPNKKRKASDTSSLETTPVRTLSSTCTISTPESPFALTQMNQHGDVTWDYGSPTTTNVIEEAKECGTVHCIEELIKCMDQPTPCHSQTSSYNKVLKSLVTPGQHINTHQTIVKKSKNKCMKNKTVSQKLDDLLESLKQDSISALEECKKSEEIISPEESSDDSIIPNTKHSESSDDLWGDTSYDDMIFLQATQLRDINGGAFELEIANFTSVKHESNVSEPKVPKKHISEEKTLVPQNCVDKVTKSMFSPKAHAPMRKIKLFENDTDSESEVGLGSILVSHTQTPHDIDDMWDDSSVDELLSTIPEEELNVDSQKSTNTKDTTKCPIKTASHVNNSHWKQLNKCDLQNNQLPKNNHFSYVKNVGSNVNQKWPHCKIMGNHFSANSAVRRSPRIKAMQSKIVGNNPITNHPVPPQSDNTSPADQPFSQSNSSSSQQYTAEEIARKKAEALRKRAKRMDQSLRAASNMQPRTYNNSKQCMNRFLTDFT